MAQQQGSPLTLLDADDEFFQALFFEENLFPISDERFSEELQLQEVIMSSLLSSRGGVTPPVQQPSSVFSLQKDAAWPSQSGSHHVKEAGEPSQPGSHLANEAGEPSQPGSHLVNEADEPSQHGSHLVKAAVEPSASFCGICMEGKPSAEMFQHKNCSSGFCIHCMHQYVSAKLKDNVETVECPDVGCKLILDPEICRPILPHHVIQRWEEAIYISMIPPSQRYYCPFGDCSVVMVDDGGKTVRQSECPGCHRFFCAECKVPWHAGLECEEFRSLNEDERGREDLLAMELAKKQSWMRCPSCKFYVERSQGCRHITCRCGSEFCYGCGSSWSGPHDRCPE